MSLTATETVGGVKATRSIPPADRQTKLMIRLEYGILCMKYGAMSLVQKEGRTSASSTTPFGTEGPTRSRAAERTMT